MKIVLCAVITLSIAFEVKANTWTDSEIYKEVGFQVLNLIDWRQTRYIAHHCDEYAEINPALSGCPTIHDVDKYFLISGLLHWGVSELLTKGYRSKWQNGTLLIQGAVVANSIIIGIRIEL